VKIKKVSKRQSVYLPHDVAVWLEKTSVKEGRTMSNFIVTVLRGLMK